MKTWLFEIIFFTFFTVAPNITSPPTDMTVVEPERASFTCVAEGLPRPFITWFLQQDNMTSEISDGLDFNITVTEGSGDRQVTSILTVASVRPSLAGMYICNASNMVDDNTENATLIVHGECLHLIAI